MKENHLTKKNRILAIVALFAMIFIAFVTGRSTTKNLKWPYDYDNYRDISSAQTIADGDLTSDSSYLNEKIWYNPLVPACIASINKITGTEIPTLYAQSGAYLNLLAPVCFALMAWVLFGTRISVVATAGYLFLVNGNLAAWVSATYSPWLFPVNFMQSFFYLLIALLFHVLKNGKGYLWYALLGALTGVTFLGHSAPTFLFGFIITCVFGSEILKTIKVEKKTSFQFLKKYLVFICSSLLFALPLIYFIVVVYRFHIVNQGPGGWMWNFRVRTIIAENFNLGLLFGSIGLVSLLRNRFNHFSRSIMVYWIIGALIFFDYAITESLLMRRGITFLPALVPSFHFYFYLKAAEAVLFGLGFVKVFDLTFKFLEGKDIFGSKRILDSSRFQVSNIALFAIVTVIVFIHLPKYVSRMDFTNMRIQSMNRSKKVHEIAAYNWIRKNTKNNDVFLSSDYLSLFVVNPAARKTVCTYVEFSNPYVDWKRRNEDRNRMLSYLVKNNDSEFESLAAQYKIGYVISNEKKVTDSLLKNKNLDKYFESSGLFIFKKKTVF